MLQIMTSHQKMTLGKEGGRKWLHEFCINYLEMYLMTGSEVESLVQQVHELESAIGSNGFFVSNRQVIKLMFIIPAESST